MASPPPRSQKAADEPLSVEERLETLELAVWRWKWISSSLVVLVVALGGTGAWLELRIAPVVRAHRVEIVNAKGAAVELSTSTEGDGFFAMRDHLGNARLRMGISKKNVGMMETYGGGDHRLVAIGGSGAGGQVALFNNFGHKVVDIQSSKTNCGAVVVNDFDGRYHDGLVGDRQ